MNTTDLRFASNKVCDIERLFHKELDDIYGEGETRMMVRMLWEAWMGWSHTEQLLRRGETINQSELLRMHWALEDLKRGRPIQYIIGWTEFCGCHIGVDETTLIPRPETEEIVEKTIMMYGEQEQKDGKKMAPKRVLDLCTGSGCIAIALAKAWPTTYIIGVDISTGALKKARENAEKNEVRVEYMEGNILNDEFCEKLQKQASPYPFDIIISNPPYICKKESIEMRKNVLDYEPETALFVDDNNALCFYQKIAKIGEKTLSETGVIVVEINEHLGNETMRVFENSGFEGKLEKDFLNKNRMIIVKKKQ